MSDRTPGAIRWNVVRAVARRDLGTQFASPTGYVFITIFVFTCAFAAFWLPGFFVRNIDSLDQLNAWFPLLLLILAPAIAMGAWAEERRSGTETLLLSLPVGPASIVLGKQLAAVTIFTAALFIAAAGELGVLFYLGSPDPGLLAANFFGQWLAGVALVSIALAVGSAARSQTIAFVLSAFVGAGVVGLGWLLRLVPLAPAQPLAEIVDFPGRLASFGRGVIAPADVAYFVGLTIIAVGLNVFTIDRRRFSGAPGAVRATALFLIRFVASAVTLIAVVVMLGRLPLSVDLTAERLWSLSDETVLLIDDIPRDAPVQITAFVSKKAPGRYAQVRQTLVGLLESMRGASGGRIKLRIVDTEPFSEASREAQRVYRITPAIVTPDPSVGGGATQEVYLGVAVASGAQRSVIELLTPGLPVEYELTRAVRAVSATARKRVGILDTEANIFGAFDFTTLTPGRDWPLVDELRKQHTVERISADQPISHEIDCLIVAQPSTLTQPQLANLIDFIRNGGPTLLLEDPLPQVNPGIATAAPRAPAGTPSSKPRRPSWTRRRTCNRCGTCSGRSSPPTGSSGTGSSRTRSSRGSRPRSSSWARAAGLTARSIRTTR